MKTSKLAMLILLALAALAVRLKSAPAGDSILKQLKTDLKEESGLSGGTPASVPRDAGATAGKVDEKAAASPWAAGNWTVSPFGSYRAHELGDFNGKFGAGLAVAYAPANNIAIELETLGETWRTDPWIDTLEEAGANFKGYLPIGTSGFAPYALVGYTRNLQIDENRMNAGAGIEVRAGRVYAFGDGRWTHNFETIGHALFRVGVGVRF